MHLFAQAPPYSHLQYALTRIRELDGQMQHNALREIFEKLAMRCSFGIINAGRNSA
ncbi:MAG TPA: hypothetical protein VET23_00700 [Chitinophagaceae bacterium]|nr:hypothetical protein [Chitinophagaceae bacterium]